MLDAFAVSFDQRLLDLVSKGEIDLLLENRANQCFIDGSSLGNAHAAEPRPKPGKDGITRTDLRKRGQVQGG